MEMGVDLVNLFLSIGFVLIGSIVFHISTIISGYSIYKEMQPVESAFLSTVAGLMIFLISPMAFIVLAPHKMTILNCILDNNSMVSFFLCAIGLGMVFGNLKILDARVIILTWIREKSNIPFWISFHGVLWDDVLSTIKRHGEIFIECDESRSPFNSRGNKCKFISSSSFDERREILIEDATSGDRYLIPFEKMGFIRIPQKTLIKHEEKINHIGQALCCLLISAGFFLLAFSAKKTFLFIQTTNAGDSIDPILNFYNIIKWLLMPLSLLLLVASVWISKKDFDNWQSHFRIYPHFYILSIALSYFFLVLMFPIEKPLLAIPFLICMAITGVLICYTKPLYNSKLYYRTNIPIIPFVLGISYLYLIFTINETDYIISYPYNLMLPIICILLIYIFILIFTKLTTSSLENDLQKIITAIKTRYPNDNESIIYAIIEKIVDKMCLEICFNESEKANFSYLKEKLICNSNKEYTIADLLIKELIILEKKDYLKYEAGTILFMLQRIIKKRIIDLKDIYTFKQER